MGRINLNFIDNATRYVRYGDKGHFQKDALEMCEQVRKGVYPCDICDKQNSCHSFACLPHYLWFSIKWHNIQRSAKKDICY